MSPTKIKVRPEDVRPGMVFIHQGDEGVYIQIEAIEGETAVITKSSCYSHVHPQDRLELEDICGEDWFFDVTSWVIYQSQDGVALAAALKVFRSLGAGGHPAHLRDSAIKAAFELAVEGVVPHLTEAELEDVRVGLLSGDVDEWNLLCTSIERRLISPTGRA